MNSTKDRRHLAPRLPSNALFLCFLAGGLILAASVNGQEPKQLPPPPEMRLKPKPTPKPTPTPEPEYEVVRVTSNLVVVPVSVTDAQGQPTLGLKQGDFHVEEEGRPQELAELGDPDQVPLDIAILLDVSSSVTERFGFEELAATRFLKQVLKPVDSATVFAIDRTPRLEQTRTTAAIASAKLLTIKAATGPSPTAFYDTVIEAARYLAKNTPEQHRRVIVVISDGEDTFSNRVRDSAMAAYNADHPVGEDRSAAARSRIGGSAHAALLEGHRQAQAEMQREVQRANAVFFSINPSGEALKLNVISTRAQNAMQQLASATGGSAFVPERAENLEAVFSRIESELRAQYLLQYYSNNQSSGAAFRHIVVSLPTHSQLRVRTREGYYPKQK